VQIDPIWQTTGSLSVPRTRFSATRLQDGRVLVIGGVSTANQPLATAEVYDPASGTWAMTGTLPSPRKDHRATMLLDGSVLVVGGAPASLSTLVRYLPQTGTFSETSQKLFNANHAQALLPGGDVLVAAGTAEQGMTAYRIQPGKNFQVEPLPPLHETRFNACEVEMNDGRVLVHGGDPDTKSVEIFDPKTGSWSQYFPPKSIYRSKASVLDDGKIVFLGGTGASVNDTAVLFNTQSGTWEKKSIYGSNCSRIGHFVT
jgi:streptogramin lyase